MSRIASRLTQGFLVTSALFFMGCGPSYPNCETDKHCAEKGEVCVQGICKQCRDNTQCTEPCQVCSGETFACEKAPGCCVSDLDCKSGEKCWMNGETGQCGPTCNADSPCPAGQKCVAEKCVPDVGCTTNADCGTGQVCEGNKCVAGCALANIGFDFDEHVLNSSALSGAEANAKCLGTKTGLVTLTGHADERGDDEYNLALGNRRAAAVKRALKNLGVSRSRLKTSSMGEERALCYDKNEDCWSRNRRVESTTD